MSELIEAIEVVFFWLEKFNRPIELLQPGLPQDAIYRLWADVPMALPHDVLEWYTRQNGISDAVMEFQGDPSLFPGFYPLSLQDALREYRYFNSQIDLFGPRYHRDWFPLFANESNDVYFIDCQSQANDTNSIIFFSSEPDALDQMSPVIYTNLVSMLTSISVCFSEGAYYISSKGYLESDPLKEAIITHQHNPNIDYWSQWIERYNKYHQTTGEK
jgi:cell wall assembly regulator SMI1